jgi:hypothetical protein
MKTPRYLYFLMVLFLHADGLYAQTTIKNRDAIIESAVNSISVDTMKALIQDMVGFHNRNNLSSMTHPTQRIGAATEYLYRRVNACIPASGGRLSVEKVFYTMAE